MGPIKFDPPEISVKPPTVLKFKLLPSSKFVNVTLARLPWLIISSKPEKSVYKELVKFRLQCH